MRVGIVGLGLMGGSLGLALRRLGRSLEVLGVARTPAGAAAAQERGAVDAAAVDVALVTDCDVVVIATPIQQIPDVLDRLARLVGSDTVLTDVASVKAPVVAWSQRLPVPERFLGGHPVAGKAQSGLAASDPHLFRDEAWIFTPTPGQDLTPFASWFELVRAIGARPAFITPELHDRQMAFLSHLAFTLSAAYAETVQADADPDLGGPGYRSMVRLAAGDPSMYEDIARENRVALLEAIDRFDAVLHRYRQRIDGGLGVKELFGGAVHAGR